MTKAKSVIMTVIVAITALSAAAFVFIKITDVVRAKYDRLPAVSEQSAKPVITDEMLDGAEKAAGELIASNYTVLELFYLQGLPHLPGPYNQPPEDGYYEVDKTAVNEEYVPYTTLTSCEQLVHGTYEPDKAAQILLNPRGYGAVYVTKNGVLGINAKFEPVTDYDTDWSKISYAISAETMTADSCVLEITLKKKDGSDNIFKTEMRKVGGQWRLTELII